jgi:hypothetical protein
MTLNDFILLTSIEQVDVLYKHGVFVGKRKNGKQVVVLYQLSGFYVEIFYRKYRSFISDINCSTSVDIAEPYLQQINLHQLLNV